MNIFRTYIYTILELVLFIFSFFFVEYYTTLLIMLTTVVLFSVLDKLGRAIVLRELISLHGCIVCLVMPLVGYTWYTIDNPMSRLWVSYMAIPADTYYAFALPAMAGFATFLSWPSKNKNASDEGGFLTWYVKRARPILEKNAKISYQIIGIGIASLFISPFLPAALGFVGSLMFFGSFSGFLYVYFNPYMPHRKLILWGFGLFIFSNALAQGMFTIVAYMGITIFSFLFMGKKTAIWKKVSFFVIGIFALLLIQSVKKGYREQVWSGYTGNKAMLFSDLIINQVTSGNSFFTVDAFFKMYVRGNQGFNVALVMRRFPAQKEYDNGANLLKSVAASIVPRAFWPDKPKAGGKFNMEYYAGFKIEGWSTNVGPLGEAYGSFGSAGGIAYMCLLAWFIRFAYFRFFWISRKIPLLLFWLPALFFQVTFSMETDTLQILNTLIKGSFFLWMLFMIAPIWFGAKKSKSNVRQSRNSKMELNNVTT